MKDIGEDTEFPSVEAGCKYRCMNFLLLDTLILLVAVKIAVFWNVMPYSLASHY
jgi:hypothetical protein